MLFEGLEFRKLTPEDIPALTAIMKRSFDDDSRLHFPNPVGGPPGYDDGSFLQKWGIEEKGEAYRIDKDGEPVGCIILFINKERNSGFLGTLFIDAPAIGHGYGGTAWRFAEHTHPQVTLWETETPAVSYRNHCFYINKCGFQVYAVDGGKDRYNAQFKLRKRIGG